MVRKYNPARDPRGQSIAWYWYEDDGYSYGHPDSPHMRDFKKLSNQTLVDSSRDWKTKWYGAHSSNRLDRGFYENLSRGNNMAHDGRYFTGGHRSPMMDDDGDWRPSQYNWASKEWEILDFDAYNRDALYKSALQKRHGRTSFSTPQDILDAEAVMSGAWKPAPPPPPPKPPEPPKPTGPSRIDLEKQLKALGIEHEKAIGGWRDQLAQQSADYQSQIAGLQAGWDAKTAAWNQQEVDWTNQFAQQQLKHETDLAAQLDKQRGLHESQLAIQGQQSAAELAQWQEQAAAEREQYAKQLEQSGLQSAQQIEQLKATFAQQQEASRLAAQEERAQLESQLQTRYTEQWNKQQQDLTSTYEGLLNQAKTEAETARIKQAQEFEQRQLDQQAGWNKQAQDWATKDRLYQSQLGELKGQLGMQEGLYAGLQDQYGSLQSSSAAERQALQSQLMGLQTSSTAEREALQSQLSGLQQSSTAERQALQSQLSGLQESSAAQIGQLESKFGQAQEDWSKQQQAYIQQIGDVTGEVTGLKTTLADSQRQAQELQSAVKRNQELAIQNAERARVSASYGTQGQPVNQEVKGVKTQNELAPAIKRYGTRSAFNRKGLRITNLNI